MQLELDPSAQQKWVGEFWGGPANLSNVIKQLRTRTRQSQGRKKLSPCGKRGVQDDGGRGDSLKSEKRVGEFLAIIHWGKKKTGDKLLSKLQALWVLSAEKGGEQLP